MRDQTNPSPRGHSTLVHRPLHKTRPGDQVIEAFQSHVRDTGCPETFPSISTTAPPDKGALIVVGEFTAPRRKRPLGDMVPCPICSPQEPQYLEGLLIWCEETSAIYAIGRYCGHKVWKDGRLDVEIQAYHAARAERRNDDYLLSHLPLVAEVRAWLAETAPMARALDTAMRGFRKKVPTLYAVLRRAQAAGGDLTVSVIGTEFSEEMERLGRAGPAQRVVHHLRGGGVFLNPKLSLERRMALASQRLAPYDVGRSWDLALDKAASASTKWKDEARIIMQAESKTCYAINGQISACLDFLSEENLAGLQRWSQAQPLIHRYEFRAYPTWVTVTGGRQESWKAELKEVKPIGWPPQL